MPLTQDDAEKIKEHEVEVYKKVYDFLVKDDDYLYSPREISQTLGIPERDVRGAIYNLELNYLFNFPITLLKIEMNGENFYKLKTNKIDS